MGIAREYSEENYKDTSGTPGYMAPEVIFRQNHSFPADFFALGVIAYECMLGKVSIYLYSDHIEDLDDRKLGNRLDCIKPQLSRIKFQLAGIQRQLTL